MEVYILIEYLPYPEEASFEIVGVHDTVNGAICQRVQKEDRTCNAGFDYCIEQFKVIEDLT
jgi:hypothetical protein